MMFHFHNCQTFLERREYKRSVCDIYSSPLFTHISGVISIKKEKNNKNKQKSGYFFLDWDAMALFCFLEAE